MGIWLYSQDDGGDRLILTGEIRVIREPRGGFQPSTVEGGGGGWEEGEAGHGAGARSQRIF